MGLSSGVYIARFATYAIEAGSCAFYCFPAHRSPRFLPIPIAHMPDCGMCAPPDQHRHSEWSEESRPGFFLAFRKPTPGHERESAANAASDWT